MRFLFYKWNAYMQNDFISNLRKSGHTVDCVIYAFHDYTSDSLFERKFMKRMSEVSYDAVISFNYFPVISRLCNTCRIPYYSWIYDSPSPALDYMDNPFNRIFFFDRAEYLKWHDTGHQTVYHLPLAVDAARIEKLKPSEEQIRKYTSDISFVGQLYQNRQPPECQVTAKLRTDALRELSKNHMVKLYSTYNTDVTGLADVISLGPVKYYTEMPLVFSLSKINLNVTLSCIKTGIPLRVLDILGSGGFLLTNYQEELKEHFIDGEDLAVFHDIPDLCRKADYYLKHEEERRRIAASGLQKAKQFYNYPLQIETMFRLGGLTV